MVVAMVIKISMMMIIIVGITVTMVIRIMAVVSGTVLRIISGAEAMVGIDGVVRNLSDTTP